MTRTLITSLNFAPPVELDIYDSRADGQSSSRIERIKNEVVRVWPLISHTSYAVWGVGGSTLGFLDKLRAGISTNHYSPHAKVVDSVVRYGALLAPVALPFYLFGLGSGVKAALSKESTTSDRVNGGLSSVSYAGYASWNIGAFTSRLVELGHVAKSVGAFAPALTGVGSILTVADIFYYAKEWKERRALEKTLEAPQASFASCLSALPQEGRAEKKVAALGKLFEGDGQKIFTVLQNAETAPLSRQTEVKQALQKRASELKNISLLSLLSSKVMFVAAMVFVFSSFTPMGLALFGVAALIGIYRFYKQSKSNTAFKNALETLGQKVPEASE